MVKDKLALSIAVFIGLASIISGASDGQRKATFPFFSLILALQAAAWAYLSF